MVQYSTRDAVADIWGDRTPYKHTWPDRVDEHRIEDPEEWVQSACVMCSNGCGMDVGVKDGRIVGVRGRISDRVNKGRLGPKGLYAWKSLSHPDRLRYPMIRKNGKLERASWDEAMNLIVERTRDIQRRLTNHAIGFYTSGQLFLEEYYALAMVGKAGLNTLHMDGNTRLCTATAAASMRESFGSDGQPGSYTDIDYTACILMVGHNMAATQTVLWSRILDRLDGPDPPELIVVDPRSSHSAKRATLHLAPRIGTNTALLNGIQHLMFKKNYINEDYVSKHTVGRAPLEAIVKEYPPGKVAEITGCTVADIERAADIIGKSSSLLSTCLQGVYQSNQATASACQVNNINLLLGHLGKPGSGIFQMNGQPTAQNNRETGCDGEYPAFRNFSNPNHMKELADLWNIDLIKLPHWSEPTHIENMLKYINSDVMEMFWISGTNPFVSLPNLPLVREALTKETLFVIVQDIFMTETAQIADVVLPAAAWGEKTGCFTNVDRTVHIAHKAVDPPGEAKSDFHIFVDFAKRMDFRDKDNNPLMPWDNPSDAFDAWKRVSKGRPCDYSGMTYEKLTGGSGIQWPCNDEYPFGRERLFEDGKFFTGLEECESFGHDLETGVPFTKAEYDNLAPRGRAILKSCHYIPEIEGVGKEYPLQLSTGRQTLHFHTRSKTGRTKELQDADPEPWIQISEKDAKAAGGVKEGEMVLVESRRGKIEVRARVGGISDGQTFIPFHYGYFDSKDDRARAANELTQERWDPVSKQPLFKSGAIRVTRIEQANPNGEVKIHAHNPQTRIVAQVKEETKDKPRPSPTTASTSTHQVSDVKDPAKTTSRNDQTARFLEYWLGATHASLTTLLEICDHLMSRIASADHEVSHGMQIMAKIATNSITRLEPYTMKYKADRVFGHETSMLLKSRLFPESVTGVGGKDSLSHNAAYDTLVACQAFYLYLGHIEGHVIALTPSAQAAWDQGFKDAVAFVGTQISRMKAWTAQQLSSRGPQTLLVPCREAVGLGEEVEQLVDKKEGQEGKSVGEKIEETDKQEARLTEEVKNRT